MKNFPSVFVLRAPPLLRVARHCLLAWWLQSLHVVDSVHEVSHGHPVRRNQRRMGPLARPAAEIAEAAAVLNQFWQTHDWLYEHQDEWGRLWHRWTGGGTAAIGAR
jgi:hypothetical protein